MQIIILKPILCTVYLNKGTSYNHYAIWASTVNTFDSIFMILHIVLRFSKLS